MFSFYEFQIVFQTTVKTIALGKSGFALRHKVALIGGKQIPFHAN
jgi:hypothetical protein